MDGTKSVNPQNTCFIINFLEDSSAYHVLENENILYIQQITISHKQGISLDRVGYAAITNESQMPMA